MVIKYVLCWFGLAMIATANGVLRQSTYGRALSETQAHQVSTLIGILLTGLFVWLVSRRLPLESKAQAWTVGVVWLAMTIAFEFGFGRYVAGHSWQRLLADYDLFAGRVWPVFLLWVTVTPYLFYRMR